MSDTDSGNSNSELDSDFDIEDKKWALLAGKAAFALELYIFRKVLPTSMIKPYVFPRNITDMEGEIKTAARTEGEETDTALEGASDKWREIQGKLGWRSAHLEVLSTAKQSYLKVNPSPEIVKKVNEESSSPLDVHRAFEHVLGEDLRAEGREVAQIIIGLKLCNGQPGGPSQDHGETSNTE